MRLITIRTPQGMGQDVAAIAFEKGISEVAINPVKLFSANGSKDAFVIKDVVEVETATPLAKKFIETLMEAPFYDPQTFSFAIRHPESLFGSKPLYEEVEPIVRPTTDVYEELYQFTKITVSLVGRVFLSSILLAYGMLENNLPLMIAGLLFLPYHHHMLGVAIGSALQEKMFIRQSVLALVTTTVLIFLAGVAVGLVCSGPVLFEIKGSLISGAILAAFIGVAAGLGSVDDAGRRELIGLATTTHISVYPAWFGLHLVLGFNDPAKVTEHLLAFLINVITLMAAATFTYKLAQLRGQGIKRFIRGINHS